MGHPSRHVGGSKILPMQPSPRSLSPGRSPLRALQDAESALAQARQEAEKASGLVQEREKQLADARGAVDAAKRSALIAVAPRSLLKAYALWLFVPFVWPGAYLFYLGRDTHAVLHTISFGGFGIGWLLDFFYIPLYVADHNEPDGYLEGVERRHKSWFSFKGLFLMPVRLALTLLLALYVGLIAAYLVPRPVVVPAAVSQLLGMQVPEQLSREDSARVGFCIGMAAVALVVQLSHTRLGRTRTMGRMRPVLAWAAVCSGVLAPNVLDSLSEGKQDDLSHAPGLILGAAGVMLGATTGRRTSLERAPHRCTQRRLSVRLVVQLVSVSAFAATALGSFYLNGSFTTTDEVTGKTTTYNGPEAIKFGWKQFGAFSGELSTLGTTATTPPSPSPPRLDRLRASAMAAATPTASRVCVCVSLQRKRCGCARRTRLGRRCGASCVLPFATRPSKLPKSLVCPSMPAQRTSNRPTASWRARTVRATALPHVSHTIVAHVMNTLFCEEPD